MPASTAGAGSPSRARSGVVAGVGGDGDAGDEGVEVRRAADPGQLAAGQLGGDRDRVGRLAAAVEVEDGVVDQLVRRAVEVGAADDLDDVGDGVLAEQHGAEHGLLGVLVLRRGAADRTAAVVVDGSVVELGDAHEGSLRTVDGRRCWCRQSGDGDCERRRVRRCHSRDSHRQFRGDATARPGLRQGRRTQAPVDRRPGLWKTPQGSVHRLGTDPWTDPKNVPVTLV